jgi:hypothetical protein
MIRLNDTVRLNPASRWSDGLKENPLDLDGIVTSIDPDTVSGLTILVQWANGTENGYDEEDLILIKSNTDATNNY